MQERIPGDCEQTVSKQKSFWAQICLCECFCFVLFFKLNIERVINQQMFVMNS